MLKTRKIFIQKLYKNLLTINEEIITKNSNNIKKSYHGIKENYSPWIYFGKKTSIEQVKSLCKINSNFNLILKLIKENNIN